MSPRRFHQVLVSASPGDAVTNEALALRPVLRRLGESEIFARYYDPSLAGEVLPLDEYDRRAPAGAGGASDDVLVLHGSIGEPAVASFVAGRPERLVLRYHNISPSGPFVPYDPAFAALLDQGRAEIAALAPRVVLALADSTFNGTDLEAMGYGGVRVSPLVVDPSALCGLEPDPATAHHLATTVRGPVLLFVGQLLPHKRPDLLLQAFHVLATYLDPEAQLILVGPARLPGYRDAVQHLVHELSLPNAWITGAVTPEALAAFYRRADVFVTASEHEGFCVPVLEAMAFEVPVVARAAGAVPETVADAAVVLPVDGGPLLLAEAMRAAVHDEGLRVGLAARSRARLSHFDPARSAETFLGHLAELV